MRYKIDPETGEAMPLIRMTKPRFYPQREKNKLPSMTIPDATMSLRTLIERYVRGIPMPTKLPIWDKEDVTTEDYLPDPKFMDLAERQEMAQNYAQELEQYKLSLQEEQADHEAKNDVKIDSKETEPKTEPKTEQK